MAKPTIHMKGDRQYWRVRIRRPSKGINVDELFTTKKEAEAFLRKFDPTKSPETNATKVTFTELVDIYLAEPMVDRKKRPLKASSVQDRKVRLNVLKGLFGSVLLKNLTQEVIDASMSSKGWGSTNRYRYESALSRLLEFAKRRKLVAVNVMTGIERAANDPKSRKRTYTDDEWSALLEAADDQGDMLGMFLRLLDACTCRVGDLAQLEWDDIFKTDRKGLAAGIYLRDPKNRESRTAFIKRDVHRLLQAHEQQHRVASSPLVFPPRYGKAWKAHAAFSKARAAAGIDGLDPIYRERLTLHHVRHSKASRLGKAGANLAQLKEAGGWKTASMASRYLHTDDDTAAEVARFDV